MSIPSQKKLLDALAACGHSKVEVQTYLTFINAPLNLRCLVRISRNFTRLVPAMREIMTLEGETYGITLEELSLLEKVASTIATVPPGIEMIPGVDLTPANSRHAPLWSFYKTNPIYVSLWYQADDHSCNEQFLQLMAHLILSLSMFKGLELVSRTYDVMLKARQILESANRPVLKSYPDSAMILSDFAKKLFNILEDKFGHTFLILFRYVLERRVPLTRSVSTKPVKPEQKIIRQAVPSAPVRTDLPIVSDRLTIQVYRMPSLSNEGDEEVEAAGCVKSESFSGKELIATNFTGKNHTEGRSPREHILRVRDAAAYVAMQNQHLTGRWDTLSEYEVKTLLEEIIALGETDDPIMLELAFLLIIMFWTGCRFTDIKNYLTWAEVGSGKFGYSSTRFHEPGWNVKSVHPFADRTISKDISSQTAKVAKGFFLPCPGPFTHIISKISMMPLSPDSETYESNPIEFEERLKQLVKKINKVHGCRLTMHRIADYLFYRTAAKYDISIAMLLTGRNHWIGENPLHYTGVKASYLQDCYRNVCRSILKEAQVKSNSKVQQWPQLSIEIQKSKMVIGSRFLPEEETIRKLIAHLKHQVATASKQPWSFYNLIGYHNALTLYTTFMIGFYTGFRAVHDPFFRASDIDWDTGFAVISDKDSEDRYNSRIVWLPPVCLKQIAFYRRHLDYLYNHLMLINPDLYRRVRNQQSGVDQQEKVPLLLLFDSNRDELEYRPAVVREMVNEVYKLPLNANRHYLRSRMLEANVPTDVINAFMGHWERGQEPWGRFSGMSPENYRGVLKGLFKNYIHYGGEWKAMEEHPWA